MIMLGGKVFKYMFGLVELVAFKIVWFGGMVAFKIVWFGGNWKGFLRDV